MRWESHTYGLNKNNFNEIEEFNGIKLSAGREKEEENCFTTMFKIVGISTHDLVIYYAERIVS